MRALNTSLAIREHNRLVYQFNRYINHNNRESGREWRRHPLRMDLKGFESWFKIWLSAMHKINDLNLHLQNIEKNNNLKKLYFQRATGRHKIVNR